MPRRPERRIGRSNEERQKALQDLQRQWAARHGRHHLSVEQLRRARALMEERLASDEQRRRAEDRIRDEYHDSRAKTVKKRKPRP
jgi:hypothetical protein